jgi:hypothetical protein
MNQIVAFLCTFIAFFLWCYGHSAIAFSLELSESAQIHATNVWMTCDAIAKSLTFLALVLLTTGYFREWLMFMFALTINNLMDELFFDPLSIGVNEYAILLITAIYYTIKISKAMYGNTARN